MTSVLISLLLTLRGLVSSRIALHLEVLAIEDVVTAVRSPWQNGYAERLIGSIRRECLDQIISNERGLRRVLRAYVEY
jgi:putative transposase